MFATKTPFYLGMLAVATLLAPRTARADEELYKKVASSTVLLYKTGGPINGSAGTGFVIDAKERLIVTARHVVENLNGGFAPVIEVMFAQTRDGEIITEAKHYLSQRPKL